LKKLSKSCIQTREVLNDFSSDVKPRVIYVRYYDHLLFRNIRKEDLTLPIRETVGWLIWEDENAIWILWDRSCKKLPHERIQDRISGILILKSCIIEMKEVELFV